MIRRTGLRRSKLGRQLVAVLNKIGRVGVRIYFLFQRRPIIVQGQRMARRTWETGSFRSTLEFVLDRYEPATTRLFHRLLRPGMTVVDIGAHGGYFSLIAASHVGPTGKVYAFEPHPANFRALQINIELNGYKNIDAVPNAVANRTGSMKLLLNSKGSDRHSLYEGDCLSETSALEIKATSLDDFLESQNWAHVDLVKMDIEGAEPAALEGMRLALQRSGIRFLVTEFSPPSLKAAGFDPVEFLQELSKVGFSVFALEEEKQPRLLIAGQFSAFLEELQDRGGTNLFCEGPAQSTQRVE